MLQRVNEPPFIGATVPANDRTTRGASDLDGDGTAHALQFSDTDRKAAEKAARSRHLGAVA
jgi:hypothetical protein